MDDKDEKKTDKAPNHHDPFLSSMTFASGQVDRGCDCDECDMIPADVRQAIQRHKRQKIIDGPLVRTQDRVLLKREESIAVWKWTMPLDAEPLLEFGNNHRIIFVEQLAENAKIMSIGKGIIGSSNETCSRSEVEWKEGRAYFVRSNGGKALGWIHTSSNEAGDDTTSGHTVVYNIKVPLSDEKIKEAVKDEESAADSKWVKDIFELFASSINNLNSSTARNIKEEEEAPPLYGIEIPEEGSLKIGQIVKLLAAGV